MNAPVSRRGLLQASTITLGAVMLPIVMAGLSAPCTASADATPVAFDPAAFVDDMMAAGYRVTACRPTLRRDERSRRPRYFIAPSKRRGFGSAYTAVMAKWTDAMDACPDHVERVVAHVFEQLEETAA